VWYHARSGVCRSDTTRSGLTHYPLTVTMGGVSHFCDLIDPVGFTITKSLSGGLSELACAFRSPEPQEGWEIRFALGGEVFWGGTILSVTAQILDETFAYWETSAVDWTWLLNRYRKVTAVYEQVGVGTAAARVIAGFTDPASGFQPGAIPDTLGMIDRIEFLDTPVSDALTRIAQAAQKAEGVFWRIRPNKAIDMGTTFPDGNPLAVTDTSCIESLGYSRTLAQVRTETRIVAGGSTAIGVVGTGSTTIPVAEGGKYDPAGGTVRAIAMDITYTGVMGNTLTGVSGIVRDIPENDPVNPVAIATDPTAQAALAARLGSGQSGVAVFVRQNDLLSYAEAQGVALTDVEQYGGPLPTITYGTTEHFIGRFLQLGKVVAVNLTRPIVVSGGFRIQEIAIASITADLLEGNYPRFRWTLEARAMRRANWYEFVTSLSR
jgi:hypothetical protein